MNKIFKIKQNPKITYTFFLFQVPYANSLYDTLQIQMYMIQNRHKYCYTFVPRRSVFPVSLDVKLLGHSK